MQDRSFETLHKTVPTRAKGFAETQQSRAQLMERWGLAVR